MTKFILHGRLGEVVGREWNLQVKSVAEGVRAIQVLSKKLYKFLADHNETIQYRIVFGERDFEDEIELKGPLPKCDVHIVPVIVGAADSQNKSVLMIVIGVALIVISLFFGGSLSSLAFSLGASMALGGIIQLISPPPKTDTGKNAQSSDFGGANNTIQQGAPVPICYGEMMVGSHTVSIGIENVADVITE
jgi:predicted phage tail protein